MQLLHVLSINSALISAACYALTSIGGCGFVAVDGCGYEGCGLVVDDNHDVVVVADLWLLYMVSCDGHVISGEGVVVSDKCEVGD